VSTPRGARQRTFGPDGYRLILPEGWTQLDVRQDVDTTVADALRLVPLDELPRDERPKRRAAIEGRLRQAIAGARRVDAFAMYLPLMGMHGTAIPASFVVAEATDFSGGGPEEEVLQQLLSAPGAGPVVIDGSDGVRTDTRTEGIDELSGQQIPARQIVYTVPVPDSLQWLLVVFDVVSDEDLDEEAALFVEALVALFDAIMTTFRWQFASS
jgi:hypothetical protein